MSGANFEKLISIPTDPRITAVMELKRLECANMQKNQDLEISSSLRSVQMFMKYLFLPKLA